MTKKNEAATIRKNVSLTPTSNRRMQIIRAATNSNTDADALRHVLDIYDELMTKQLSGYEILLEPKNGEGRTIPYRSLFDSRAVNNAELLMA
jgi:hypothetical protein